MVSSGLKAAAVTTCSGHQEKAESASCVVMATFGTAAGLHLAEEQQRACCSGRLEFDLLGGLRGGSSAGVRTPVPEKKMRIVRIKGDGRCLFRALVRSTSPR